jgi:hypothetical protein
MIYEEPATRSPVSATWVYSIEPSQKWEKQAMSILNKSSLCPNCGSAATTRSRKNGLLEQILHSVFFLTPFRCNACDERYFRFRMTAPAAEKSSRHTA